MKNLLLVLPLVAALCGSSHAADGMIGPVDLASLSVIAQPIGLHVAGNVEVRLARNFAIPPGMSCGDSIHLTTLRSEDPGRAMFRVLEQARKFGMQPVLYITDDPLRNAYIGRCSITGVQLGRAVPQGAPICSSFTPHSGLRGAPVTLSGANFVNVRSVKFGESAADFYVISPATIKTFVPEDAEVGTFSLDVTTDSGTDSCGGFHVYKGKGDRVGAAESPSDAALE